VRRRYRQRPAFRTAIINQLLPAPDPVTLTGQPQTITARSRARESMRTEHAPWYRIENKASGAAEVYLYSEIGFWGVTADEFVKDLNKVKGDTIDLRINSEGGEVFDGITIFNALRNHAATVNVTVDGLAASAASFIAMAGDTITMDRGSQMMIHDAQSVAMGNASDMRNVADLLDKASNTIASFYAERAGGTVSDWRKTMATDAWYTAEEAVAAGLADSCVSAKLTEDDAADTKTNASAGKASTDAALTAKVSAVDPDAALALSAPDDVTFEKVLDDAFALLDAEAIEPAPLVTAMFDPDTFRVGLRRSLAPPPFDADLFKAAMYLGATTVGALETTPQTPVLAEAEPFRVDPAMFRRALREATL
jgi:ATP-dependent protease ClpP protease subunit